MSTKRSERPYSGQRSPRQRLKDDIRSLEVGIRQHRNSGAPNPALLAEFEARLIQLKAELEKTPE